MVCDIVIGANYGDEGKGLISRLLSYNSINQNEKVLNILFNGGCQRGHTVDYTEDFRHVYKHFGAGTLDGADTYYNKDFILNPMQFNEEYNVLAQYANEVMNTDMPKMFCHRDCRVSTPFDMVLNQMVELNRDKNRHGSCGWGIFETRKRYEKSKYNMTFMEMRCASNDKLYLYLESIAKEYLPDMIEEYGINDEIIQKYREFSTDRNTIINFINDFRLMCRRVEIIYFGDLIKKYDEVVYEAGQGLALSETNIADFPHLTPSKTGSEVPIAEISPYATEINIHYVTRTYFTRHGAGPLYFECDKDLINPAIEDKTNHDNDFQKSLRFAPLDYNAMLDRIIADSSKTSKFLHITHANYNELPDEVLSCLSYYFKSLEIYRDKFGNDVGFYAGKL